MKKINNTDNQQNYYNIYNDISNNEYDEVQIENENIYLQQSIIDKANTLALLVKKINDNKTKIEYLENIRNINLSNKKVQDEYTTNLYKNFETNTNTCGICFDSFLNTDKAKKTVCGHYFHPECLDQYLSCNSKCPICDTNLL